MSEIIFDKYFFKKAILAIAENVEVQRDYLSALDSDIGDGDHGINLSIGFRAVAKEIDIVVEDAEDIDTILRKVGMTLLSKVGGASGPLYGSFFIKMGSDVKGQSTVTFSEFVNMINNGVISIETRGKAVLGDKTMVDALRPATDYLLSHQNCDDYIQVFSDFVEKVKEGSDNTIPLQARKGRALRLKERSIGFRDPGSASSVLIMEMFLKEMKK